MEQLIYISESRLVQAEAELSVSQIIESARIRNAKLAVTGALLFTGVHFAQILEGPSASLDQLIFSIRNDVRHINIEVVNRSSIEMRRFPDWKMVYHGPSQFVSRHVIRLLQPTSQSEQRRASQWLTQLAHELSTAQDPMFRNS